MVYIGEITIKVEFAGLSHDMEAQAYLEGIAMELRNPQLYNCQYPAIAYVETHTVYDEEDMRKEMEGPDINAYDRQNAIIPCFKCLYVDSDQRFEPCESCMKDGDFKGFIPEKEKNNG